MPKNIDHEGPNADCGFLSKTLKKQAFTKKGKTIYISNIRLKSPMRKIAAVKILVMQD